MPFFVWQKTWNFYSNHLITQSFIVMTSIDIMACPTTQVRHMHCTNCTLLLASTTILLCVKSTDFRSITSPPGTANSNKYIDNDQRFKMIFSYIYLGTNRKRHDQVCCYQLWWKILLKCLWVRFSSNPWKAKLQLLWGLKPEKQKYVFMYTHLPLQTIDLFSGVAITYFCA